MIVLGFKCVPLLFVGFGLGFEFLLHIEVKLFLQRDQQSPSGKADIVAFVS